MEKELKNTVKKKNLSKKLKPKIQVSDDEESEEETSKYMLSKVLVLRVEKKPTSFLQKFLYRSRIQ